MTQESTILKYELTPDAVIFLLQVLDKVTIVGIQNAKNVLALTEILQNPINKADIEKAQLEILKNTYEPKA